MRRVALAINILEVEKRCVCFQDLAWAKAMTSSASGLNAEQARERSHDASLVRP